MAQYGTISLKLLIVNLTAETESTKLLAKDFEVVVFAGFCLDCLTFHAQHAKRSIGRVALTRTIQNDSTHGFKWGSKWSTLSGSWKTSILDGPCLVSVDGFRIDFDESQLLKTARPKSSRNWHSSGQSIQSRQNAVLDRLNTVKWLSKPVSLKLTLQVLPRSKGFCPPNEVYSHPSWSVYWSPRNEAARKKESTNKRKWECWCHQLYKWPKINQRQVEEWIYMSLWTKSWSWASCELKICLKWYPVVREVPKNLDQVSIEMFHIVSHPAPALRTFGDLTLLRFAKFC